MSLLPNCPYGKVGDRLWVRETWHPIGDSGGLWFRAGIPVYRAGMRTGEWAADDKVMGVALPADIKWKPSIFMPRWASRLTLEITGVRVERAQDITEEDALAEGSHEWLNSHSGRAYDNACEAACRWTKRLNRSAGVCSSRGEFAALWDSINKKRGFGFDDNPWVWVLEIRPMNEREQ